MRRIGLAVVLTIGFVLAPLAAEAQMPSRVYRIGVLSYIDVPIYMSPFVEGLRAHGWVEGRDFTLERRFVATYRGGADAAARDLVAKKVDVIVTLVTGNAMAAMRATTEIPIVMIVSGYPVEVGLAKSYARPGGNVTGNTAYAGTALFGKHVEILKTLLPRMRRLAVLWGYLPPFVHAGEGELALGELKRAAQDLAVTVRVWETRRTEDVDSALKALATESSDALYISGGSVHTQEGARIGKFAQARRMPTITDTRAVFETGGALVTYSADPAALARQAARFVDRILRGAHPSDLPIEQPTKFELVINLKTAKALRLKIPQSLLLRADQVIE
jgi:putative ABC transport system substrate-binding protein